MTICFITVLFTKIFEDYDNFPTMYTVYLLILEYGYIHFISEKSEIVNF